MYDIFSASEESEKIEIKRACNSAGHPVEDDMTFPGEFEPDWYFEMRAEEEAA